MPLDDNTQYWIARGSDRFGPYSGAQVRAYVASGNIAPSDRICADGGTEWTTVAAAIAGAIPPAAAASGGMPFPSVPPTGQAPYYGAAPADDGKTFAYLSLVMGIVGLLCCGVITAIPGVIFGILALNKPAGPSRGVAIAGLIISIIALLFGILAFVVLLYFPQFLPQGLGPQGFGTP
jgi:hypothetical protein